jgi:hypothetical protein
MSVASLKLAPKPHHADPSNTGFNNGGLFEISGDYSATGGAINKQGVEPLVFVLASELVGGVASPSSVGFYVGTPENFLVGPGGGGYLNVTSNSGCAALQAAAQAPNNRGGGGF